MIYTFNNGNRIKQVERTVTYTMKTFRPMTKFGNPPYTRMISSITPSDGDRMKWGAPTWTLFHCIPENLTDNMFIKNKDSIFRMIVTICGNLPCPSCSEHARQYMNKVNFVSIKNIDDLRKMLFIFHNSVNERKGYAEYSYDKLIEKYNGLDFKQVVNEFMHHFQKKTYSPNLIAQQMYRQKQVAIVKKWFQENIQIFQ